LDFLAFGDFGSFDYELGINYEGFDKMNQFVAKQLK
jgi:hypothetical protein